MLVSLLLGFFYLSGRPILIVGLFTFNILGFVLAYLLWGFPTLLSHGQLSVVGWISILSATIYMSWMAIYYANMITMGSELEREAERHRETGGACERPRTWPMRPTVRNRSSWPR